MSQQVGIDLSNFGWQHAYHPSLEDDFRYLVEEGNSAPSAIMLKISKNDVNLTTGTSVGGSDFSMLHGTMAEVAKKSNISDYPQ